jgi:hypothetical protein
VGSNRIHGATAGTGRQRARPTESVVQRRTTDYNYRGARPTESIVQRRATDYNYRGARPTESMVQRRAPDTTEPGFKSKYVMTVLISVPYRICVLCGNATVHNSGVGCSTYTHPPSLEVACDGGGGGGGGGDGGGGVRSWRRGRVDVNMQFQQPYGPQAGVCACVCVLCLFLLLTCTLLPNGNPIIRSCWNRPNRFE